MKIKFGLSNSIRVGSLGVPISGIATQSSPFDYGNILVNTYGAQEVWPLVDISAGTTIPAKVTSARNGTETGWDLQNTAGPVTNTLAPFSDGVNDFGNVFSSSLAGLGSGGIGSYFIWAKVTNAAVWSDATIRRLFYLLADGSNRIILQKSGTANNFQLFYQAGGTSKTITDTSAPTTWFSAGASWRDAANGDEVKAFINGAQFGATATGNGTFVGSLTQASIGATGPVASNVWAGWFAFAAIRLGSIWTPTDFANMHAAINP